MTTGSKGRYHADASARLAAHIYGEKSCMSRRIAQPPPSSTPTASLEGIAARLLQARRALLAAQPAAAADALGALSAEALALSAALPESAETAAAVHENAQLLLKGMRPQPRPRRLIRLLLLLDATYFELLHFLGTS